MSGKRLSTVERLSQQTPGQSQPAPASAYGSDASDVFFQLNVPAAAETPEVQSLKQRVADLEAQVTAQGGAIVLSESREFIIGNFRVTPTGMIPLVENITEVELKAIGIVLFRLFDSLQFNLGDWLNEVSRFVWGADEIVAKAFRKKLKTIQNWKTIAGNVPYHIRRGELDYTHHAEVSALPHDKQIGWLEMAVVSGWDTGDLRRHIADSKKIGDGTNKKTGRPVTSPATIHRPYQRAFKSIWADLMAGVLPKKEEIKRLKKWLTQLEKDENS